LVTRVLLARSDLEGEGQTNPDPIRLPPKRVGGTLTGMRTEIRGARERGGASRAFEAEQAPRPPSGRNRAEASSTYIQGTIREPCPTVGYPTVGPLARRFAGVFVPARGHTQSRKAVLVVLRRGSFEFGHRIAERDRRSPPASPDDRADNPQGTVGFGTADEHRREIRESTWLAGPDATNGSVDCSGNLPTVDQAEQASHHGQDAAVAPGGGPGVNTASPS